MPPQQPWHPESWERSPAPVIASQKWGEAEKIRDVIHRDAKDREWKDRDRDRDLKDRDKDKKKSNANNKKKKEKEIKTEEEQKKLDLDTR